VEVFSTRADEMITQAEDFVRETFDQWLAWHAYLATARDPY